MLACSHARVTRGCGPERCPERCCATSTGKGHRGGEGGLPSFAVLVVKHDASKAVLRRPRGIAIAAGGALVNHQSIKIRHSRLSFVYYESRGLDWRRSVHPAVERVVEPARCHNLPVVTALD
jgi:hypothetical protein